MNSDAPFCRELYQILLLNPKAQEYRLTFGPNDSLRAEHYLFNEDENLTETLCPTSTFLAIFRESHDCLAQFPSFESTSHDSLDLYCLTLGLLLTTPGNQTALNLHERIFLERLGSISGPPSFLWLRNELLIVERFLTSTNNRLNKSSSLWYFYRKLVVVAREMNCDDLKFQSTVIHSASRHFSNYYCWTTARWLYDVISVTEKARLLKATLNFSLQNISDVSSWSALSYMICQHTRKAYYNFKDYERLKKNLHLPMNDRDAPTWPYLEIEWYVEKIINAIDIVAAEEWPPYLCLLTLVKEALEATKLKAFSSWRESIHSFEEKHGAISFLRHNPVVPSSLSDNALLSRNVRHYGLKKLFLLKIYNQYR